MFKRTHPAWALFALAGYLLGPGLVRYLGRPLSGWTFSLGSAWTLLLFLSFGLLLEVFHPRPTESENDPATRQRRRTLLLVLGSALFMLAGWMAFLFLAQPLPQRPLLFLFSGLITLLGLACVLPPFQLLRRGWGEFVLAILIADLLPSFGYLLLQGEIHRFLAFLAFPLTLLTLAFFLAQNFITFAGDQKHGHLSLLQRLSWPRGVILHQSFLVTGYLFFLAAPLFGFSLRLLAPLFLAAPFAAIQAYLIHSLAQGAPARWRLLNPLSYIHLALLFYLLLVRLWIG
ncbi:MAG: hypothetical protein WHS87_11280 [Anaerolineales bacterium]